MLCTYMEYMHEMLNYKLLIFSIITMLVDTMPCHLEESVKNYYKNSNQKCFQGLEFEADSHENGKGYEYSIISLAE